MKCWYPSFSLYSERLIPKFNTQNLLKPLLQKKKKIIDIEPLLHISILFNLLFGSREKKKKTKWKMKETD